MIACKMAKQTIKCENSYIIQKSIYAGWKDYMQGLESKNTGAKFQRRFLNFPQKYVDFFLKTAYNTSTRRCSLYSESHYR